MDKGTLLSIVLSSIMVGAVGVLLIVREPTIPLVLLAVGVIGQLVAKLRRSAKKNEVEQCVGGDSGSRAEDGTASGAPQR